MQRGRHVQAHADTSTKSITSCLSLNTPTNFVLSAALPRVGRVRNAARGMARPPHPLMFSFMCTALKKNTVDGMYVTSK